MVLETQWCFRTFRKAHAIQFITTALLHHTVPVRQNFVFVTQVHTTVVHLIQPCFILLWHFCFLFQVMPLAPLLILLFVRNTHITASLVHHQVITLWLLILEGSGVPTKRQGDNVCSIASLILQGTCPIEIISDTTEVSQLCQCQRVCLEYSNKNVQNRGMNYSFQVWYFTQQLHNWTLRWYIPGKGRNRMNEMKWAEAFAVIILMKLFDISFLYEI
jgi:hypothetical protein